MTSLLRDRRTQFYLACMLLIGLAPLALKGLQFGMDFRGGSVIQIKLDVPPGQTFDMQTVVTVMQNRLNAFGLKDVTVRPFGNDYIIVEVAETDQTAINQLQSLIGQQGKFETLFEGNVVLAGEDIVSVITDPQRGYGVTPSGNLYEWTAPFLLSSQGADRFAKAIEGRCTIVPGSQSCTETVYMFIDRPAGAVILMDLNTYGNESRVPDNFESSTTTVAVEDLVKNSGLQLIVTSSLTDSILGNLSGKEVIIPQDTFNVSRLQQYASKVVVKPKATKFWIVDALGLENIVHLTPGVTTGKPITEPSITGSTASLEAARQELNRVVILLKSGKLPVSVSVGSVSTISPTLGSDFLYYSALAGLVAMASVTVVLFVRYKKVKIAVPVMITLVSEIFMILGVAALIGWQLDLPSVAGIITAIGTGVNDQIIVVDEILRGEGIDERILSMAQKIKKAFSIIFMAAGTIVFAMFPLLFMGLGVLRGFAITTIVGVVVGIFITRPAFASWVDRLLT